MKLCETCGNEAEDGARRCPFCGSPIASSAAAGGKPQRIVTVNLKSDLPTAEEAVRRLGVKLGAARSRGAKIARVIHGWGASGSGGRIKRAVRSDLRRRERRGQIKGFVAGEDYPELSDRGRRLLKANQGLKRSLRTDRRNRGITLVEL